MRGIFLVITLPQKDMIIQTEEDLKCIQEISDVVAITLKKMREYAKIGMTTKELDNYGAEILKSFGQIQLLSSHTSFRDGPA